jgi:hypothetical protein
MSGTRNAGVLRRAWRLHVFGGTGLRPRDVAQAAVIAGGGPSQATSKAIAGADRALLNGQPQKAVNLLRQAAG